MNRYLQIGLLLGAVMAAPMTGATVLEVGDNGFALRNEAVITAPAKKVWDALVRPGKWWDSEHTYSGDARRMKLDAEPGGCFCEELDHGGGVAHAEVVQVQPGKVLRLVGSLGPLQQDGVAGSLTWSLKEEGGVTTVTQTYSVGGYRQGGFVEMAPIVDHVMSIQLQRLQRYLQTGTP